MRDQNTNLDSRSTNSSNSVNTDRRTLLKSVGGSLGVLGAIGTGSTLSNPVEAATSPDDTYEETGQSCYSGHRTMSSVAHEHYHRGHDDLRDKYEFVTAISSSAAADENGNEFPDIVNSYLSIDWDDTKFSGDRVNTEPDGFDPISFAYQEDVQNPDEIVEEGYSALGTAGDALSMFTPYGWVWGAARIGESLLDQAIDKTSDPGHWDGWWEYETLGGSTVPQVHYTWIIVVWLDIGERLSIDFTNKTYGSWNDTSIETEVIYDVSDRGIQSTYDSTIQKTDYC